jgi:carboxynorspermidine decarboxylase
MPIFSAQYPNISSPCYVLEEKLLIKNLELIQYIQQESDVAIICALKGYAMHSTFPLLKKYLAGATASSLHEAKLIHEYMGVKAHTYCPVYLENEWDEICSSSAHLTFNSLSQWEKFKYKIPSHISCGLRVNPGYSEIATDLYNPASPHSRLGIGVNELNGQLPIGIDGLHFHALCENDSYTTEKVLDSFSTLYHDYILQAKWVNMGGGHLMTRKDYDVDHLIKVLKAFRLRYPHLQTVILEPGSAIGWQTGFLKSTVVDIVERNGITTAMLDVSFTCHMPDCLEMPYQPIIRHAVSSSPYKYRMGGMSCLAGDYMGDWYFESPLEVGQEIIFEDMIHYTMVKTTTFNGINLPSIGVIRQDETFELVKKFDYNDYKNRLS